ncbi:helix-turn-helix domain-containing protein [Paenibacillus daejeonensis]|uniref:helix-turn-helix domain-containing protein n=1 Tax=Paenibacillus daejeonensis TaxID=135193 RepID=UPI00037B723E|nr:helix-turn-helix domain-containing protein [Paenibacillus daejeonensis]
MNNWYKKQLLSYFPIFLLTITVIVVIGMVAVSDISRRETERANEIFARYISEVIVGSLSETEQAFLKEFTLNASMMDFLDSPTGTEAESIQLYQIASSLRGLEADYSLLESIYLYRAHDNLVLMANGKQTLSQFYDREFLQTAIGSSEEMGRRWSGVRTVPGQDNRSVSVISLVKQLPLPFGQDGVAVINVKVNGFANDIMLGKNRELTYLDIIDADGEVVLSSEKSIPSAEERSKIAYLAQMPIDATAWSIRSGIKSGQFSQWFELISYTWIAAGVAVVLLSTIYVIYISRRSYRPIALILNKLQTIQLKTSLTKAEEDDVRFIEEALEDLTDQMTQYQRESQDNLLTRRRQLFIDLIEGTVPASPEGWQAHVPLEVSAGEEQDKLLLVAHVELERLELDKDEVSLMRLALQNVIQDVLGDGETVWCEWIYGNRLGMILLTGDDCGEEAIRLRTQQCREWVEEHFDVSFLFGAGTPFRDWSAIPRTYQDALRALDHRLTRVDAQIIFATHVSQSSDQPWLQFWPLVTEIGELFQMRSEHWRGKTEHLFTWLQDQQVSDRTIFGMIDALLKLVQKKTLDGAATLEQAASDIRESGARLYYDDLISLEEDVLLALETAYQSYEKLHDSGSFQTVMLEMRAYIQAHYDHPDLSLKHLSDRFQLNGKNVSQLFKESFGENFGDYVQQLRITKAKKLLTESDISQQEIATLVGYSNSITFGRMFKRTMGMTPGEYRKQSIQA